MLKGVLIGESLRIGAAVSDVSLRVIRIWREEVSSATASQPRHWTLFEFEAEDDDARQLATRLAACLSSTGSWYIDFRTPAESFVVFAGRIFRYPRGDARGRAEAQTYGRAIGVPELQLDWPD
jgi:hypothetical protein